MSTDLMNKLRNMNKTSAENRKVPLSDGQVIALAAKIQADNRGPSVWVNKFDVKKPYRVQIPMNKAGETDWLQYGYFTDVDVAAAVGAIASLAAFGDKAKAGEYDADKVVGHPEYLEWLAKDINQQTIAAANGTTVLASSSTEEADISQF